MESSQDRAKRIAERKRVDTELAQKKAQQRQSTKPSEKPKKVYPLGVRMMGKGFQNLHDTLGNEYEKK